MGDIELMGVPPLGKTLPGIAVFGRSAVVSPAFKKQFYKELQEGPHKLHPVLENFWLGILWYGSPVRLMNSEYYLRNKERPRRGRRNVLVGGTSA